MATTAIWKVEDNLKRVVEYAMNPEKTENPNYNKLKYNGLANVIDYTTDDVKTEQSLYVSTINCVTSDVVEQMETTKEQFNKTEGILAFHGYQSFKEGEVTPEVAHQIGIELAEKLWGDRFQVVVTTHLDKKHFHNHFVINSVSFVDGKRYYDNNNTYRKMRTTSDELCKKYRLSVIDKPKKGKHYAEWLAEQNGQPTWRSIIKQDIDSCIDESVTYSQFVSKLKDIGYELKLNRKHIAVKPPTKERFVRLRSIGDEYTEEFIKERILHNSLQQLEVVTPIVIQFKYNGNYQNLTKKKIGGLRGLYFHYLYKMGSIPNNRPNNRRVHILLKEDLLKLDKISKGANLLTKNKIDTMEQLKEYKNSLNCNITNLKQKRKLLYNKLRRSNEKENIKAEISLLSKEIFSMRKEVMICEDIETRSLSMKQKLKEVQKERGEQENEQWRRSR